MAAPILEVSDTVHLPVSLTTQLFRDFFETNTTEDPTKDVVAILSVPGRLYDVNVHHVKK